MVETSETAKTPVVSKRAKWEKIKKELLKLPRRFPEIIAIAIEPKTESIKIILDPVSLSLEDRLWDNGRILKNKFDIPFEHFDLENMAHFRKAHPGTSSYDPASTSFTRGPMGTKEGHLAKARSNEESLASLNLDNSRFLDWAITVMFYAALHYVDAFLATSATSQQPAQTPT